MWWGGEVGGGLGVPAQIVYVDVYLAFRGDPPCAHSKSKPWLRHCPRISNKLCELVLPEHLYDELIHLPVKERPISHWLRQVTHLERCESWLR